MSAHTHTTSARKYGENVKCDAQHSLNWEEGRGGNIMGRTMQKHYEEASLQFHRE